MTHSDNKRIEAVTAYLVLGKASLAEAATKVPAGTIRRWKMEPWWDDLVDQIQSEEDRELDSKLARRLSKALDIVDDRLESGDFMFDPKSGQFRRRPVSMKDTWKVTKELMDARTVIRSKPRRNRSEEAASGILRDLAKEFAALARQRINERVIDGEVISDGTELQAGVPAISGETPTDQTPGHAEQSPSNDDETRPSPQGG